MRKLLYQVARVWQRTLKNKNMIEINKKLLAVDTVLIKAQRLTLLALIIALLSVLSAIGYSFYIYNQTSNKVFVLDEGGDINPATKTDGFSQLAAEGDNHLRMFYSTFFSYDPVNVETQVAKGIELGGEDVKNLWKVYTQKNWYNKVKQANIIIEAVVDSTFFDFKSTPYRAKVYGRQIRRSGNEESTYSLNMTCDLIKVSRVKSKNPHGLLIDNIILENEKIDNRK